MHGLLVSSLPSQASELSKAIPECLSWLAQAPAFTSECRANARPFSTEFYPSAWLGGGKGEQEFHRAWFAEPSANGHFVMGCTLRFDGSVNFIGAYYAVNSLPLRNANKAPIVAVGFSGDVTLDINGDTYTLIAVHPFDVNEPKKQVNAPDIAKNCEDPTNLDYLNLASGHVSLDITHFDKDGEITIGGWASTRKPYQFIEFFKHGTDRQIIYSWNGSMLITIYGSVLVRKDVWDEVCLAKDGVRYTKSSFLPSQICRLVRNH